MEKQSGLDFFSFLVSVLLKPLTERQVVYLLFSTGSVIAVTPEVLLNVEFFHYV